MEAGFDKLAVVDEAGLDIAPAADPSDRSMSNGVAVVTRCCGGRVASGGKWRLIDPPMPFGVSDRGGVQSWALETITQSGAATIAAMRRASSRRRFRLDRCFTRIALRPVMSIGPPVGGAGARLIATAHSKETIGKVGRVDLASLERIQLRVRGVPANSLQNPQSEPQPHPFQFA